MTTLNPASPDLAALQHQLLGRMGQFRRRVRMHLLVEGVARVLAEVVGIALLSFILDRVFRLGLGSRLVFLAIAIGFISWEVILRIVRPLKTPLDAVDLATAIDHQRKLSPRNVDVPMTIAARVAAVLQLPDLLRHERPPSEPMVRRAVERSYASLQDVDFDAHLDPRRRQFSLAAIAGMLILPMMLAIVFPAASSLWAKRWLLGSSQAWPQKTYLTVADVKDGRILVPRGEPHVLRVGVKEGSVDPETVAITLRVGGGGKKTTANLTRFDAGDYRYDLPPLQTDATITLTGGDDEVGPIQIEPVDRPRVAEMTLTAQHPTQPVPESHRFAGIDAEMAFLPKTRLELRLASNVAVAEVRMKSVGKTPPPAELRRLDDKTFSLAWAHEASVQLSFELIGTVGDLASVPTPVSIGLKVDQAPRVTLQYTGVRQRVTPQARIPLSVQSRDDNGLVKVDLATQVEVAPSGDPLSTTQPTSQPVPRERSVSLLAPSTQPSAPLEAQYKHEFDVSAEKLTPGAILAFTGRATDGNYTGPQTGESRTVAFRVVAPEELFREILLRQQAERAKFRKAISEAEKLRSDLNTLAKSEDAIALTRQHRLTQRESARVGNALAESVTEMRLNALGGQEAWDLMENGILKPLRALHDGPMSQQRDALDALGGNLDPQKITEAATRQDEIIAGMNDVLKQMSQWDSFVDVINQLNEIIKLQDNVKQNTEKLKEKQTEGVFE